MAPGSLQRGASAQQSWPVPPHSSQLPLTLQDAPTLHPPNLQQGSPGSPHAWQVALRQVVLGTQKSPGQQVRPRRPQERHWLPSQKSVGLLHGEPLPQHD
jgi:hypothetical protein